jgi:hypothetical protein
MIKLDYEESIRIMIRYHPYLHKSQKLKVQPWLSWANATCRHSPKMCYVNLDCFTFKKKI